jgi:hypothetical protein
MSSYTIESESLLHLLQHLNNNMMDTLSTDDSISKNIQTILSDYSTFQVTVLELNRVYLLQDSKHDIILEITQESKHINPELEIFTSTDKLNKEALQYNKYQLSLIDNTNFNQNVTKRAQQIKKIIDQSVENQKILQQQKEEILEKWNKERTKLYSDRKLLINRNKELFKERQLLSKDFYSSDKETRSKTDFIEKYRNILKENEQNKESVLDINKKIDLLDRKATLYLSETFFYNPPSSITIRTTTKEESQVYLQKKGGKSRYDVDFLEGDSFTEGSSIQSYYEKLKKDIKKMNKRSKNKSNRQLYQELQTK